MFPSKFPLTFPLTFLLTFLLIIPSTQAAPTFSLINVPGDGYCALWALQLLIAMLYGVTVQLKPLLQDKILKKQLGELGEYFRNKLERDYHDGTSFDINIIAESWPTIIRGCPALAQTVNMFQTPEVYICNDGRNQSWDTIHALLERKLVAYGLVCHGGHFYLAVERDRIPDFFSPASKMFYSSMVSDSLHPTLCTNILSRGDEWMKMWEEDACKNTIHAMHVAYLLHQRQSMEEIGRKLSLHSMYLDYMSRLILGDSTLSFHADLQAMSIAELVKSFGVESSHQPANRSAYQPANSPQRQVTRSARQPSGKVASLIAQFGG